MKNPTLPSRTPLARLCPTGALAAGPATSAVAATRSAVAWVKRGSGGSVGSGWVNDAVSAGELGCLGSKADTRSFFFRCSCHIHSVDGTNNHSFGTPGSYVGVYSQRFALEAARTDCVCVCLSRSVRFGLSVSVSLSRCVCLDLSVSVGPDTRTNTPTMSIMQMLPGCKAGIANIYLRSHIIFKKPCKAYP